MSYDLEGDLLRAAHELCRRREIVAFTLAELRDFIAGDAQAFPRLGHPLVAHLVEQLAERLQHDGLLACEAGSYAFTDEGHALLRTSPRYLRTPAS
jgi:hypothetical protein